MKKILLKTKRDFIKHPLGVELPNPESFPCILICLSLKDPEDESGRGSGTDYYEFIYPEDFN